jgi:hypothetical protein
VRLTLPYGAFCNRYDVCELGGVGDNYYSGRIVPGFGNNPQVDHCEQVPALTWSPRLTAGLKPAPVKLDSVDANVDQHFNPVRGFDAVGMA